MNDRKVQKLARRISRLLDANDLTRRHVEPLLVAAGIDADRFRLYDLRHSCATLMLRAGVNVKTVRARLAHANIVLTLNVY